ncbi:MAG: gliding motility-associated C-terminal domain-containing protein, partial [Saprospiraceae bacterium]
PGFCTSFVHHMQWIGFIAGSTDLTLEVKVSNCTKNGGLEIGLYESLDCNTFRKVSDCDTDVKPNTTRIFSNTVPLTIGQYYYFVMDGSNDDICDWSIKVTKGTTKVLPLASAPTVLIPDQVCQNKAFDLSTPGITGATFYKWTIDGAFTKNIPSFSHTLEKPGKYNICLTASNVCDEAPMTCKTIEVLADPTTSLPKQEICFGECYLYHGKKYCETGKYEIRLPASNGCDSIITLDLVVNDKITATKDLYICEGDTLTIGDGRFYTAGTHQATIKNQEGCNIFLTIQLRLIVCNIKMNTSSTPVKCNGENTGQIDFSVKEGTPPFTYRGYKIENPSIGFQGSISSISENIRLTNLDEGNYTFTIEDTYGNSRVIYIFVEQPTKLMVSPTLSSYNGYNISCYGSKDGSIKWITTGGVPIYTYKHDFTSANLDTIDQLTAGRYSTTITDQNGCTVNIVSDIIEPTPLTLDISPKNPDCTGPNTGIILISKSMGGVTPYLFSLNGDTFSSKTNYTQLSEGNYTIKLRDKNGCLANKSVDLVGFEIPSLKDNTSIKTVNLGDSLQLMVGSNLTDQKVIWSPTEYMSCPICLSTNVLPINDTKYQIKVTSKDGCESTVTISIIVNKIRSFVMSNIFSPNGDGVNDLLKYYAGHDVSSIQHIDIYDRWGNLVYQNASLTTGHVELPWAGTYHDVPLSPGQYTWICDITYLDNVKVKYSGMITLLE